MDPINNLNQIMQILRQRLAQRADPKDKVRTHRNNSTAQKNRIRHTGKASIDEVMQTINQHISALGPEGRGSPIAVKIFVESVLAWEFGDELLQDDQFNIIVNDVQNSILENESVHNKLLSLFDKL